MSVFVDDARRPYGRMKMCHMIADTDAELHAMARAIGLKAAWFQDGNRPHYDLCLAKRAMAIERGAKLVTSRELIMMVCKRKESCIGEDQ